MHLSAPLCLLVRPLVLAVGEREDTVADEVLVGATLTPLTFLLIAFLPALHGKILV